VFHFLSVFVHHSVIFTDNYHGAVVHKPKQYVSGCIQSASNTTWTGKYYGGAATGFKFIPGRGVTWAFELVGTLPPNSPSRGNDVGWWAAGSPWVEEIDFFEYTGYDYDHPCSWLTQTNVVYYSKTDSSQESVASYAKLPQACDNKEHRWTHVVYPDLSMSMWIDGKLIETMDANGPYGHLITRSKSPPTNPYKNPMALILSYGVRSPGKPTFQERSMHVRSIAVYESGARQGVNYWGGGIAPGTTVRHTAEAVAHADESATVHVASSNASSRGGMPSWEVVVIVVAVALVCCLFLAIVAVVVVIRRRQRAAAAVADNSRTVPLLNQ